MLSKWPLQSTIICATVCYVNVNRECGRGLDTVSSVAETLCNR